MLNMRSMTNSEQEIFKTSGYWSEVKSRVETTYQTCVICDSSEDLDVHCRNLRRLRRADIHEDVTLRGAMRIVADSHETHFPVVDDDDQLVGIFSLTDLRRIFLENVVEDMIIVRDFMKDRVTTVRMQDSLHEVQRQMTRRNVSAVPVVDSDNPRKVIALLERNTLGAAYAERLQAMKEGA